MTAPVAETEALGLVTLQVPPGNEVVMAVAEERHMLSEPNIETSGNTCTCTVIVSESVPSETLIINES